MYQVEILIFRSPLLIPAIPPISVFLGMADSVVKGRAGFARRSEPLTTLSAMPDRRSQAEWLPCTPVCYPELHNALASEARSLIYPASIRTPVEPSSWLGARWVSMLYEPALPSVFRSQKRPAGELGLDPGLYRSRRTWDLIRSRSNVVVSAQNGSSWLGLPL